MTRTLSRMELISTPLSSSRVAAGMSLNRMAMQKAVPICCDFVKKEDEKIQSKMH